LLGAGGVGTPVAIISQLNILPACAPVNASMAASRLATHQTRRKPQDQWLALIPQAHEGYVSWADFERIQRMVRDNNMGSGQPGAARQGAGLLSGLLRCRRCGRKLSVRYTGNQHDVLRYACHRGWLDHGEPRCIAL
jgi:hypothetical protein